MLPKVTVTAESRISRLQASRYQGSTCTSIDYDFVCIWLCFMKEWGLRFAAADTRADNLVLCNTLEF